ncbi:MAG: response regulator [Alphaproteobacteria bacterium]|nr:response regulator [Alphaproteobacteria bacterium]
MHSCVPFFYHPTTVLLIDDDRNYLRQLQSLLSRNAAKFIIETNPPKALQIVQHNLNMQTSIHNCFNYLEEEELETYRMAVNVSNIYKMIYNDTRFDQISTVIVDYNMPGMNGLEFCKKIQDTSIRKILLTGETDETLVIKAFNEGVIDAYIRKHEDNFYAVIQETLEKCQAAYFSDFSKKIEAVFDPEDQRKTALCSEKFKNYFKIIIQTYKIKEFYMLERTGSFLCIDEDGNHGVLTTQSKESVGLLLDSQEALTANPKILNALKDGTHILCNKHIMEAPLPVGSSWREYAFSADCLMEDDETFLCAYIPGKFGLKKENLRTFNQSKKEMAAA